jgi:hypothetical protein
MAFPIAQFLINGPMHARDKSIRFVTRPVLRRGVTSTSSNPQDGGPHLVACALLLIQYISSYPPYTRSRPFLHPHLEDTPCRGDRDPLFMEINTNRFTFKMLRLCTDRPVCIYIARNAVVVLREYHNITELFSPPMIRILLVCDD